jgi:hypothetical protein
MTASGSAAAAAAFGGCHTIGGYDLEHLATDTSALDRFVARTRGRVVALQFDERTNPMRDWAKKLGFRPGLVDDIGATLIIASAFRDLPRRARDTPVVQEWVKGETRRMTRTVFETAELLEALPPAYAAQMQDLLRSDPEVGPNLAASFEAGAVAQGVSTERAGQVRAVLDNVYFRSRHHAPKAYVDDYVGRLDRLCQRAKVDRRRWRTYTEDSPAPEPQLPERGAGWKKYHPIYTVGLRVLGIGAIIGGVGVLTFLVGIAFITIAPGVTIAGFMIVVGGLAVMAVGVLLMLIGMGLKPK